MRIPLDYYRILGLPIQATAEQLQQAHRDRVQQLPRREFSEVAITARKQLIDQAYNVLSDPIGRQEYDNNFLAKSYDLMEMGRSEALEEELEPSGRDGFDPQLGIDPYTPSIEIDEAQFVGALLTLLELGEYELVLRLGRPYLGSNLQALKANELGDPETVAADIVLTIALAYLELGREQWQQGQYESAAASLENGQELLLQEGIFTNIRSEMQSDLFKLRPYRILELVSLPEHQEEARRQGISLLEDMLHDRQGIDGDGDDLSGLGVDDFLRFIQQLRGYLTAAEQQVLFEAEARRPSGVAIYLAVYALLARGFAQRQPALIRRAKMMLIRLGGKQDVHLEQAVCSLLLGQTEEASRALELSQEFESLAFIRDHSQGSPDLLPGLCLYSERWFQNEVFPHFRDLHQQQASLTEYFADEDVQLYLEDLPTETDAAPAAKSVSVSSSVPLQTMNLSTEERVQQVAAQEPQPSYAGRSTATIEVPKYRPAVDPMPQDQPADTIGTASRGNNGRSNSPVPQESTRQPASGSSRPTGPARRSFSRSNLRLDRIMLLAALGLLGIMLLGFLFGKLLNRPQTATATASDAANAGSVAPAEAALDDFTASQKQAIIATAPLTEENAPEIIKSWLTAKAAAMGEEHAIDQLDQILVDPALSQQKTRAEAMKESNSYWNFDHSKVEIIAVQTSGEDTVTDESSDTADDSTDSTRDEQTEADSTDSTSRSTDADSTDSDSTDLTETDSAQSATIEAMIGEKAELYTDGQVDTSASYDSTVRVQYDLVRQDNQWRIRDMEVLE